MNEKKDAVSRKSTFDVLRTLNVNEHTDKKVTDGGRTTLTYLSWPWAWAEFKKAYPTATYSVRMNTDGSPAFTTPLGIMVYTSVTADGLTYDMWLPVMNGNNRAMKTEPYEYMTKYGPKTVEAATMMDVNKAVMRCLVKNLAMFGLGLYIYAGEDLPEEIETDVKEQDNTSHAQARPKAQQKQSKGLEVWKKYYERASTSNPELDADTIKQSFAKLVADQTGKSKSSELTDDDWAKVEQAFAA